MNISQMVLMLLSCAETIEREVVCNDDFDGNEDVTEAIEDIRNVAMTLRKTTGVDSKAKAKRAEHARNIKDVFGVNDNNKEFQYFFAYTTNEDDAIHCMGCSDSTFDLNMAVELACRSARCVRDASRIPEIIYQAILEDDGDD